MKNSKPKTPNGFTLGEILVVVTLIVILGLASLIGLNPHAQFLRGHDTVRRDNLAKLKTALENYYNDHSCYPEKSVLTQCGSNALQPYLDKVLCDPATKEPYTVYTTPIDSSCPQKYAIYTTLSMTNDPKSNNIYYCPNTIAVSSTDMSYIDLVKGCSGKQLCEVSYGCKNGACVIVAQDSIPTCGPSFCPPSTCPDCTLKNRRGVYLNECRAF